MRWSPPRSSARNRSRECAFLCERKQSQLISSQVVIKCVSGDHSNQSNKQGKSGQSRATVPLLLCGYAYKWQTLVAWCAKSQTNNRLPISCACAEQNLSSSADLSSGESGLRICFCCFLLNRATSRADARPGANKHHSFRRPPDVGNPTAHTHPHPRPRENGPPLP